MVFVPLTSWAFFGQSLPVSTPRRSMSVAFDLQFRFHTSVGLRLMGLLSFQRASGSLFPLARD